MAERLKEMTAIVIGAGQVPGGTIGNGRATSVLFAREGASVMLVDNDMGAAQETYDQIREEGGSAFPFQADITDDDSCLRIVDTCLDKFDHIDIVVYNVGISDGRLGLDTSPERWDAVFNANLKGVFRMYQAVMPVLEKRGSGVLINISSIAAVTANTLYAYKSSKAGVNALTQAFAVQYAPCGIRVNAIMPGLMNTPMAVEGISKRTGVDKETLIAQRNARVPLKGGMGTAWDIAYAALFLASDEARFISGAILPVDGAQSARVG